ncbi:unnamed protein product [Mycena citricolor]|uniref:G domain-containing protein n=1 Tax=Mycena citricolor TaxID=2018698 RepID=A0AAD2H547_9AGAR|nr:unnamed protein product [Mycena citricolor]
MHQPPAPNNTPVSAVAHTYRPFYLSSEDSAPADSYVAAAKEYLKNENMYSPFYVNLSSERGSPCSLSDRTTQSQIPREKVVSVSAALPTEPQVDELAIAERKFINLVSGSSLGVGRGLKSCTSAVQVSPEFELDGRVVTLIDTPGFDDTSKSDVDVLNMIALFLAESFKDGRKLAGVIYMHRISDFRVGGISRRNFKMFRELCGDSTLKNVVIATNMWGEGSREIGEAREMELATDDAFFRPVLDKGASMLRHDDGLSSAHAIIRHLLQNKPRPLRIQRELVEEKKDLAQTAAGQELDRELAEQMVKHKNEMKELEAVLNAAIKEKDEEYRQELQLEMHKFEQELGRMQSDSEKLASESAQKSIELEHRLHEMDEQRAQDELAAARYREQIATLNQSLEQTANMSVEVQADLQRQLREAMDRLEQAPRHGGFFVNLGTALDKLFGIH